MSEDMKTVFLIDDEAVQLNLMEAVLSQVPANIRSYSDPEAAWEDLMIYHPQVVLLDLNMPKLGGQAWMVRLSEERKMNDFHLVVVTGNRMDEDAEFGLYSMGAVKVLEKPVNSGEILDLVNELLQEAP